MKIKLSAVFTLVQNGVFKALDGAALNAKEKWNLLKFVTQIEKEFESLDKVRSELVKKYGTPGENDQYNFSGENKELFANELTAVFDEEVEVHTIKLPLSKLDALTLGQLKMLEDFIDEEA